MAEGAAAAVLGGLFGDKYVLILCRVDKLIKRSPYFQAGFGLMVHFCMFIAAQETHIPLPRVSGWASPYSGKA